MSVPPPKDHAFDRLLHLTIGAGIVVFGFAEPNIGLTFLALAVWAGAWFVSVGPRGEPLPRVAIGLLVLGATAYTLLSVVSIGPSELVGGVARYLLFLQLIKLFDRIAPRDRGQLLAMSIALVVGACLMSNRLLLGFGLLFYVPLVLWSAAALQMHLGRARTVPIADPLPPPIRSRPVRRALARTIATAGALIVAVMVAGFVFLPRGIDPDVYSQLLSPQRGQVGYEEEVRLGAAGFLNTSDEPVLELRVTDLDGRSAGDRVGRMYLRGAVLENYEGGSWVHRERNNENENIVLDPGEWWRFESASDRGRTFVQRIELKNKNRPQLFSLYRPVSITVDQFVQVRRNRRTQMLSTDTDGRLSYTVIAELLAPVASGRSDARLPRLFEDGPIHDEAVRILDEYGLTRDESQQHTPEDLAIARRFEQHLQARCVYTTEMVAPDADEDPIEMFLFRTRRGHCEYFASAMAAMLRAVGMDARVVTGYMVTEERLTVDAYVVRESDAHAWVEAQVAPGVWRTFDPSPPEDLQALHAEGLGIGRVLRDIRESLQDFWARGVVGYSRDRQIALFGDWAAPLEDRLRNFMRRDAGTGVRAAPARAVLSAALAAAATFSVVAAIGFIGRWFTRQGWRALLEWRARKRVSRGDDALRERLRGAAFYYDTMRRLRRAGLAPPDWSPPLRHADALRAQDGALADALRRIILLYYAARYGGESLTDDQRQSARAALATVDARLRALDERRRKGAKA